MKNMKKLLEDADNSILDELIQACEQKMGSKFAPKKEESEMEDKEVAVLSVESDDEDDMDEEKMARLMEIYKSLKG
jgi:hypothetical protein